MVAPTTGQNQKSKPITVFGQKSDPVEPQAPREALGDLQEPQQEYHLDEELEV